MQYRRSVSTKVVHDVFLSYNDIGRCLKSYRKKEKMAVFRKRVSAKTADFSVLSKSKVSSYALICFLYFIDGVLAINYFLRRTAVLCLRYCKGVIPYCFLNSLIKKERES